MTADLQRRASPTKPGGRTVIALLTLAGTGWGTLAWWSHTNESLSVWWLLAVLVMEWGIFLALTGNALLRGGVSVRSIWITAVTFRVCGLFATPILEDDHHRFLWDGYVFAHTGNPYATAPADWFDAAVTPDEFQEVLDQVNYP
ncbi:MAG TPA: hypothetical protein VLD18_03590, partial [Verrucomicrobiae bacterium]|nr:hypothetical protein [Verrucomicrobiae bacterium]